MTQITPDTLLPVFKSCWAETSNELGSEAKRWQVNRVVQPHGTRRTVLLWRVWDKRCKPHGLDKNYFCWCFNYDPEHYYNRETHWQLHLYINKIRLYRHAEILRTILPKRLKKECPEGFRFVTDDHSVQLTWNFNAPDPFSSLEKEVPPMLTWALEATAPIFDEIFSILKNPSPEEKRHTRQGIKPNANRELENPEGILSRDIRPAVRRKVIERDRNCGLCNKPFTADDEIHVDHIIPWSKGGLTTVENLQATHAQCNLTKGNKQ